MNGRLLAALPALLALALPASLQAQHEHHQHGAQPPAQAAPATDPAAATESGLTPSPAPDPSIPAYTLQDLERRALEKNPALAQADAAIRAAEGRRVQGGLLPNPIVGVAAEDVPLDGDREEDGKYGLFIAQDIPLGGKLRYNREVLAREVDQARIRAEAQRSRLTAQIHSLFYRTLAAQHRVEVRERLAALANDAVEVTKQLYNVGAADGPDQLAVENEALLREASLAEARIELDSLWGALRAAVNDPALETGRLDGDLAGGLPTLDREEWRQRWLAQSPALREASAEVARAEASLARARAARTPDLTVEGGVLDARGEDDGKEAFAEVGIRVPLFNRNQGGIAAAEADLAGAQLTAERVRLSLESQFAESFARYREASERARTYREGVLARARSAYQQYFSQYQQMMAAYPQVLISQRTLFQLEESYVQTLERAWQAAVGIQSLLPAGEMDMGSGQREAMDAGQDFGGVGGH